KALHDQREAAARATELEFDLAKREHEKRRDEIKNRIDELHRKIASLRTDVDREAAFSSLRDEGRLEERVTRIARELAWLADRVDLVRELSEEQARAEQATTTKGRRLDELTTLLRQVGDVAARLADLGVQRAALEAERSFLEAEVANLRPAQEAFTAAKARLEALQGDLDQERKAWHLLEGQAKAMEEQIAALGRDAEKLKESERARDALRADLEVYDMLVNRVFHKRGVVMYAVEQLLPELEIEASKNLSELTDGRFRRVRLETYEEGRGHGVRILVQGVDGQWHDVAEFSGGEKTQINAALRFAIARELASMPQIGRTFGRMKTLFIDEGDLGSLDTEVSRELFVQKLLRMGEFFEKVILITHLAEVADRFPGRIRVTMTPDQESRAEVLA